MKKIDEKELELVYELNNVQVRVFKDNDNLYFQSTNPIFDNELETTDSVLSVAALMRIKDIFKDDKFWNIKLKDKYNINAEEILYWITGGDNEWKNNKNFNGTWDDLKDIFIHKYEDTIFKIVSNSSKLLHIRNGFLNNLNLPMIYEFALNNNLIK